MNSTWLITSELANQRVRKTLFICVVYTKWNYTLLLLLNRCNGHGPLFVNPENHCPCLNSKFESTICYEIEFAIIPQQRQDTQQLEKENMINNNNNPPNIPQVERNVASRWFVTESACVHAVKQCKVKGDIISDIGGLTCQTQGISSEL